ncbi:P pilus assembly protein, porin PapC [Pseudomonas sp. GM79]|uniref:fimbria/pilus outer membrane usher protein n=1 Tax=Pseudomonas sp. GM79 TaxID=1144338 RepID=UPI00026FA7DD|nr:fimbria/pilus outer membrane usher protein [Pseudomonas sp. GM79]EJN20513.1 P pilus assembly protein, porin PapC [Pseudomonas sp. GM79]
MSRRKPWYGGSRCWVGSLVLVIDVTGKAWGETPIEFDRAVLEARGIDPKVAEHFRDLPRFQAGRTRVLLQVNGSPIGQVLATFDDEGQLCLDANLLDYAGIAAPPGLPDSADDKACLRATEGIAAAQVRLSPGQQQVALLVPTDLLLAQPRLQRNWASGGVAGVLNYDALVVSSSGADASRQYRNLGTELGFNAGDWVVRSRQNYTAFEGVARFETLYTQASRTWERYQANVQLGQLNMRSSLFAGEPFTGIQVLPETAFALRSQEGLGVGTAVEGIAYSPSRIEVRQSGVVIYTTLVPAGPFTLRDIPVLSLQLDLEVTVIEESGEQRHFRVPAANVRPLSGLTPPGFAIAAGQVRRFTHDERETPSFFAASKDWQWGSDSLFTAGWMGSSAYQSLGWGVQQALTRDSMVSIQHLSSRTASAGQGQSLQATFSTSLGPGLSASLTAAQRTNGFRTLADIGSESLNDDPYGRAERQWGASVNYSDRHWGAFSGSMTRYAMAGSPDRSRISASWSREFGAANLSLNVQRESGDDDRGTGVYATLGFPLGRNRSLRVYGRQDRQQGMRTGARYNEQVSETSSYSINAERADTGQTNLDGRISLLPRYTSVDLGYSHSSVGTRSYDFALRGGVAVHESGLTPSPYALRDTFGLLKIGSDAGIKISTPQGPVWTDGTGRAVAASLPAYQSSRLEIDTVSLPRNVEVLNGFQEIETGRGAVPRLDFKLSSARRLMLHVRTEAGQWVPKGGAVYDSEGVYLTSVVETGLVYIADAPEWLGLQLTLPDDRRCLLEFDTRQLPETTAPYQAAEVTCRAGDS